MEIIFGQLRLVVASMDIEEINSDRDKFLSNISHSVETELKKVGLKLIRVKLGIKGRISLFKLCQAQGRRRILLRYVKDVLQKVYLPFSGISSQYLYTSLFRV